jgi:hypothetical protein
MVSRNDESSSGELRTTLQRGLILQVERRDSVILDDLTGLRGMWFALPDDARGLKGRAL